MIPKYIISPKVTEKDFETIAYKWLSEGDLTPDDIIENIITQKNLFNVPLYYYRHDYGGNCTASLGYVRQESYSEYDVGTKSYRTKTREVVKYFPHTQLVRGNVYAITVAQNYNFNNPEIVNFIENTGWDSNELLDPNINPERAKDLPEMFTRSKQDMWDIKGASKMMASVERDIRKNLPSNIVMNFKMNVDTRETNFFGLVAPFWLFSYDYGKHQYYLLVDANNPQRVTGTKPEDSKRKKDIKNIKLMGWILGMIVTLGFTYLFLGGLPFKFEHGVALIIGLIMTSIINKISVNRLKKQSIKVRKIKLDKKLNERLLE